MVRKPSEIAAEVERVQDLVASGQLSSSASVTMEAGRTLRLPTDLPPKRPRANQLLVFL